MHVNKNCFPLIPLSVQHLASRGIRGHISVWKPKGRAPPHSPTANMAVYLVCGPLYLHRHDEVCIANGLVGRRQRERGEGWHAAYIHMALHNKQAASRSTTAQHEARLEVSIEKSLLFMKKNASKTQKKKITRGRCTLKELCTRVSSRSMTTQTFPWSSAFSSGRRLTSDGWGETSTLYNNTTRPYEAEIYLGINPDSFDVLSLGKMRLDEFSFRTTGKIVSFSCSSGASLHVFGWFSKRETIVSFFKISIFPRKWGLIINLLHNRNSSSIRKGKSSWRKMLFVSL